MAGSVNKVILIGNLGADPEIPPHAGRYGRSPSAGRHQRDLARQELGRAPRATEWHRVVVFNEACAGSWSSTCARAPRSTSRASSRPANGRTSRGRSAIRPRSCCRASIASSDARRAAAARSRGERVPDSGGGRRHGPRRAGAGGLFGDEIDDESVLALAKSPTSVSASASRAALTESRSERLRGYPDQRRAARRRPAQRRGSDAGSRSLRHRLPGLWPSAPVARPEPGLDISEASSAAVGAVRPVSSAAEIRAVRRHGRSD